MGKLWFTSDTHFGHANIITYSRRPYKDVAHMNEALIQNWNALVQPEDTIYHLGDFAMGPKTEHQSFFRRLHGRKVLVRGNHDQSHEKMIAMGWDEVSITREEVIEGKVVYMAHVPVGNDPYAGRFYKTEFTPDPPKYFDFWFAGHVHEKFRRRGKVVNVGVDVWGYGPVSFQQLIAADNEGLP